MVNSTLWEMEPHTKAKHNILDRYLNLEISNEYLKIAKRDLECSESDYQEERYDKSLINLQRSVEKISWGLYLNLLKESKDKGAIDGKHTLKDVSHDSPKSIYRPSEYIIENIENMNPTILGLPGLNNNSKTNLQKDLNRIMSEKQNITKYEKDNISERLSDVEEELQ